MFTSLGALADMKTLLLIEEDPTLRAIISFRFELLGFEVLSCESGHDAIEWLANSLPDAVIVGHYLPDMEGVELIDRLSNEVRTSEVPVMLLSPNSELVDVQKAFNAGADDYLVTPFDPLVLEKKVRQLIEITAE